jgi:DNA-binding NtrC family response regulator
MTELAQRGVAHPAAAPGTALQHDPILIVEDDPDLRMLLVALFDDEGLAAVAVETGPEAIVWLRDRRPALVILDLNVPKVPREGVLQELLDRYEGTVPVITVASLPHNLQAMRKYAVWTHLGMPLMMGDLLSAVYAYLT